MCEVCVWARYTHLNVAAKVSFDWSESCGTEDICMVKIITGKCNLAIF